ncbi:DUF4102 domain-containing protein [Acetobacteraceae bacterium]|nr:DUF4102 domain-containing protein [Acetobacteraceae bacterium]
MARKRGIKGSHRLTEEQINEPLENGYYGDGDGLYLRVARSGKYRTWSFRFKSPKVDRLREYNIGNFQYFSLNEARKKAEKLRKMLERGIDPAELRTPTLPENRSAPYLVTFEDAARSYIQNVKAPELKDRKGVKTWISSLEMHVFPYIGSVPVSLVEEEEVLSVLKPIWSDITETATRIRMRIEKILDYARAEKWRKEKSENPARWVGILQYRLPNPAPILRRKKTHFYALKAKTIPGTMVGLESSSGKVAKMVRFLILTGGRSIEIREAVWEEIDLEEKIWTIPKERMKATKDHIVPLCEAALNILKEFYPLDNGRGLIFRNQRGNAYTDKAMSKALKIASNDKKATIHGLRSTMWDWCAENKVGSYHAIQQTFAHTAISASDAAYFRSDLLNERKALINAWENFVLEKS